MGSMSKFYTRDAGNEGIKLPLVHPNGSMTEDFLIIRSIDSDAFREAENDAKREAMKFAQIDDEAQRKRFIRESTFNLQIALVKDWSFDEPCTPENIREFLTGAPHIADAIDQMAGKRRLFIAKKPMSLEPTPEPKPKKPGSRKAQAQAPKNT